MKAEDEGIALYTFVFDFQGGTYIAQVRTTHLVDAKRQWAIELETEEVGGFDEVVKQSLIQEVEGQDMAAITNMTNVWCFTVLLHDQFGMVHVIKTSMM